MMYSSNSAGPWIWLHIHWIFVGLALFGSVAALLWLYKHAKKKDFLKIVWACLGIGIIGMMLTASLAMSGWSQMMSTHGSFDWDDDHYEEMEERMDEMMDFDDDDNE
jgi:hypothetical protein